MQFLNLRDEGGLIWPKISIVTICGITVTTFQAIMSNETMMADFQSSTTSSRAVLREKREMLSIKIKSHFIFQNKNSICKKCECNRQKLRIALITTAFNVYTKTLTMILTRNESAKNVTLRMVKVAKKGQACGLNEIQECWRWPFWLVSKKCDENLKANKVMRVGNLKELRKRCDLIHLLSDENVCHAMNLSELEARQACNTLSLLEGSRL